MVYITRKVHRYNQTFSLIPSGKDSFTTMPRPAIRRNRKAPQNSAKQTTNHQSASGNDNLESAIASELPSNHGENVDNASHPIDGAEAITMAQQMKNQTPMSKTHEQAIESSPMGEGTATGSRPPTRARGYSSTLSLAGRKGDMSSKVPGTPAFESSVLSNFRRRARQPSILQMMQTENGSSDLDDDDFLGGLSPEDESTPLNVSRGKSLILKNAASPSAEFLSPSSDKSRKRKRAPEELQVPQSPLNVVESTPIGSPDRWTQENEAHDRTDTPQPVISPEAFCQTVVPPMSSSAPQSPARIDLALAERESPVTLESTKEPSGRLNAQGHLSTADLQSKLLPRRRQRRRRHNDSDVSNDDDKSDDDDELNYLPSRKPMKSRGKQTDSPNPSKNTRTKPTKQKKPLSKPSKRGITYSSATRTPDVDKENQPDDMSSPLSSALDSDAFGSDVSISKSTDKGDFMSEELRLQAKKFAEVDNWQMEFEDVISTTGSQGSPFR